MANQDPGTDTVKVKGKTALVLCGGGSRGAVEVGLYRALIELGYQHAMKDLQKSENAVCCHKVLENK